MGRGGRKNRGSKKRGRTQEETTATSARSENCGSDGDNNNNNINNNNNNNSNNYFRDGVRIERSSFDAEQDLMNECPEPGSGPWVAAWQRIARQKWPKEETTALLCRKPTSVQNHVWPILCSSCSPSQDDGTGKTTQHDNDDDNIIITNRKHYFCWNLICLSPTGSGKTLAYGLPLLLSPVRGKSSLILLPTRELVQQVGRELLRASKALLGPSDSNSSNVDETKTRPTTRITVQTIHGGVDRQDQLDTIRSNLRQPRTHCILVATSGRLVDLVSLAATGSKESKNKLLLESVSTVILDEADQLVNNRDLETQVESILMKQLQPPFRICLFSATWPDKVTPKWREWIRHATTSFSGQNNDTRPCAVVKVNTVDLMEQQQQQVNNKETDTQKPAGTQNPKIEEKESEKDEGDQMDEKGKEEDEVSPAPSEGNKVKHLWSEIPSNITQTLHVCADHKKPRKLLTTLQQLISSKKEQKQRQVALGIIFFGKIKTIQYAVKFLRGEGISSVELHSQMSQSSRERAVLNFKSGKIPLLLATDIAARGLHVSGIRFVVNYDFPGNMEHYVHRCGRAGRDGKPATVYSFFTRNLAPLAPDIVHLLETCKQWVDPNLLALVGVAGASKDRDDNDEIEGTTTATQKDDDDDLAPPQRQQKAKERASGNKKKKARIAPGPSDGNDPTQDDDNEDYANDFPSLALDRIALKRASHVSDASESDESNED